MGIKMNFRMILLVLTILAVFLIPSYVLAAENLNDFFNTGWEDITDGTGSEGTGTEGKENTENATNTGTGTQENGSNNNANTNADNSNNNGSGTNTNQNNNKKPQSYDKAGIAEDTMMVVAVISLVMIAICAYNKVNEYKGI